MNNMCGIENRCGDGVRTGRPAWGALFSAPGVQGTVLFLGCAGSYGRRFGFLLPHITGSRSRTSPASRSRTSPASPRPHIVGIAVGCAEGATHISLGHALGHGPDPFAPTAQATPLTHPFDRYGTSSYLDHRLLIILMAVAGGVFRKKASRNAESYFSGGQDLPCDHRGGPRVHRGGHHPGRCGSYDAGLFTGEGDAGCCGCWPLFSWCLDDVPGHVVRRSNVLTGAEWMRTRFGKAAGRSWPRERGGYAMVT